MLLALTKTLNTFNQSILNTHGTDLSTILSKYKDDKDNLKKDFHDKLISEMPELSVAGGPIEEILESLGVPRHQQGRFLGAPLTVYDFLVELDKLLLHKNRNLAYFIDSIDHTLRRRWDRIILAFGLALLGVEVASPYLTGTFTVINEIITAALFIPIASALYTIAVFLYAVIDNFISKKRMSFWERLQNNFFEMASATLKLVAYGLVIAGAAISGSPLVSALIVIGTGVSVIQELAGFIHLRRAFNKEKTEQKGEMTLGDQQVLARHESDYLKRRNSLLINVVSAVLITGLVAAWCFIPGGLFVMVGAVVAIFVVNVVKKLVHMYFESSSKKALDAKFEQLETEHLASQSNSPSAASSDEHDMSAELGEGLMSTAKMSMRMVGIKSSTTETDKKERTHTSKKTTGGAGAAVVPELDVIEPDAAALERTDSIVSGH